MRTISLSIMLLACFGAAAQDGLELDSVALLQEVDSFTLLVQQCSTLIDNAEEIDTIHALAGELETRSAELIMEAERIWPIDEALKFEVDLNNVPQINMDPALSLEYQQRAHAAQEKIDAMMPGYYQYLRSINSTSARMGSARKLERARRLNEELKEMDLMVREIEE